MFTRRWLFIPALVIIGIICLGIILHLTSSKPENISVTNSDEQAITDGSYQRIISLSPSITESLFALGLGDRVVGVTNFCDYPPEALTKSKIGGYSDLNLEAIVALNPDIVVCLPEHESKIVDLERLDISHLTVDHRKVEMIMESLITLGQTFGASEQAKSLVEEIRKRIETVEKRAVDGKHPRVLICVGRNMGSKTIDSVFAAGSGVFYDEMITMAGGINAYQGNLIYPDLTGEGLLRLEPDIIIDMVADLTDSGVTEADVLKQWDTFPDLPAVKHGHVFLFTDDFVVVPGPRFINILEKIAAVIQSEDIEL